MASTKKAPKKVSRAKSTQAPKVKEKEKVSEGREYRIARNRAYRALKMLGILAPSAARKLNEEVSTIVGFAVSGSWPDETKKDVAKYVTVRQKAERELESVLAAYKKDQKKLPVDRLRKLAKGTAHAYLNGAEPDILDRITA